MPDIPISLKIKVCGEAGDGILTIGDLLMIAAARQGYFTSVFKSYPPNIRGGYSQALVTISEEKILSSISDFNILFSLSRASFNADFPKVKTGNLVLVDAEVFQKNEHKEQFNSLEEKKVSILPVPVTQLSSFSAEAGAVRSTVGLAVISALFGLPQELLQTVITARFKSKGDDILHLNSKALDAGYIWADNHLSTVRHFPVPRKPVHCGKRAILGGNQAIGLGSIAAGCTFFSSYPITPATQIGDYLSEHLPETGGFAYQAEDEIAALGSALGASFSGAKAMTATSGPGLSLMQEFIGYASMVELPVVIVDIQRVGPSTGMPTKHGQDDLLAAAFGGHGEAPRIVVAPIDVEDCFYVTVDAFNLSERYQCPVILLSDGALGMVKETVRFPAIDSLRVIFRDTLIKPGDAPFLRFRDSESGVNPIPVPGISPVTYRATGVEHGEDSVPTEIPEIRTKQIKKRFRKIRKIERENASLLQWDLEKSCVYKADFSLIGWGITASVCRQAVQSLRLKGYSIAALYPRLVFPVCVKAVERLLLYSGKLFIPETNFSGQYSGLIRMYTDAKPVPLTLSSGETFTPEEIEKRILRKMSHDTRKEKCVVEYEVLRAQSNA